MTNPLYQQIGAAWSALSPTPATLVAGCATLNAQTAPVMVDVPVQAVAAYLGANMKLASFMAWAAAPPAGASATSIGAAAELAFAFEHPRLVPVFALSISTIAAQMEAALEALVSPGSGVTGPITAADQTAILALASQTVPVWSPPLMVSDLQAAVAAGLIPSTIPVM